MEYSTDYAEHGLDITTGEEGTGGYVGIFTLRYVSTAPVSN